MPPKTKKKDQDIAVVPEGTPDNEDNGTPEGDPIGPAPGSLLHQPSIGEPFGIERGGFGRDVVEDTYSGTDDFEGWAVRGNRSQKAIRAITSLYVEDAMLRSKTYRPRSDHMLRVSIAQDMKNLLSTTKKSLSNAEIGGLVVLGMFIMGVVGLTALLYAG